MGRVVELEEAVELARRLRREGKRLVFTNGCFDLLHVGHVRCLEEAKRHGDVLFVGLNSDRSTRAIKGDRRPLVPQGQRAEVLAALRAVDYVVIFDEPTPLELIRRLRPHVLVKGGDWTPETIVGRDEVEQVVRVPLVPGVSTTAIVQEVLRRYA